MAFTASGRDSSLIGDGGAGTPPGGWTLLVHQYTFPVGNPATYHILARVADGAETSLTVTTNTSAITAEQFTTIAAIDALSAAAFTGFSDLVEGPVATDNTGGIAYIDTPTITAPVTTNIRLDVVGGNLAVSSTLNTPTPAPGEVVVIGNEQGTANRGAFGVFAYTEQVGAGDSAPSRRYTANFNDPESVNSFLLRIRNVRRSVRRIDFR